VRSLIEAIIGDNSIDEGFIELKSAKDISQFIDSCRQLRFWQRNSKVKTPTKDERKVRDRG
jgi:hypothetical protein